MKSLLKCCGSTILVGLHTRAFLIEGENRKVTELLDNEEKSETTPSTAVAAPKTSDPNHQDADGRAIQCVAVAKDVEGNNWCAISRYDKSLSVFRNATWVVTQKTIKRAGCLVFGWDPVGMIIAGDMVGDATAYSLEATVNTRGRLLVGHTASMLTGIQLVKSSSGDAKLLTADRDEKVRISSFPQSTVIHGYLLGHDAFLCSMDTSALLPDMCITCGGDETVRLWNIATFEQLSMVETRGLLPTQVSTDGERVGVIFHNSKAIHIYTGLSVTAKEGAEQLQLQQTLECEAQPLGIVLQNDSMYVLAKDPVLLQAYQRNADGQYALDNKFASLLPHEGIVLPSSILEADPTTGHLKMQKLKESRGPAQDLPWHRNERVQKAKDSRSRRQKKRKTEA